MAAFLFLIAFVLSLILFFQTMTRNEEQVVMFFILLFIAAGSGVAICDTYTKVKQVESHLSRLIDALTEHVRQDAIRRGQEQS